MKRIVFILLVVGLLLCAEAVTLVATRAESGAVPVQVHSLDFFYKLDEKTRFLDLKTRWQNGHSGPLTYQKADELAVEAYQNAGVEEPFDQWRYHGGPSPNVFSSKIHLYNTGKVALLDYPLTITVRARVGELRVNPEIQMTDYAHLKQSARWQEVSRQTIRVPAIAPGADKLIETAQFRLMDFLAKHPNQWPVEVEVRVSAPQMTPQQRSIALTPDHFVVPVLY